MTLVQEALHRLLSRSEHHRHVAEGAVKDVEEGKKYVHTYVAALQDRYLEKIYIYIYIYCLLELNMLCLSVTRGCGDHLPLT